MLDLGELILHIRTDTTEARATISGFASDAQGIMGKVGGAVAAAGKVMAAGTTAAATGVAALTKASLDSYASYEQLIGGVETLFKDSSSQVQSYADQAYKTAGMSANQYMETVTSFSASMLQSLGGDTKAAAEMSNQAIIDMSDNANKMGTDMTMIQNAYQGFAKQNYTMLDNLKLGYGGTKKEMERLIADANKVKEANGEMADLSISSFADVTEAIHIIQTEMGITGTTAKEASTTVEGSVNAMKSAWGNWLTELGKENGDMKGKTQELVDSVVTVVENIVPIIQRIIPSVIDALGQLLSAAGAYLLENGPTLLVTVGAEITQALFNGILSLIGKIPEVVGMVARGIVDAFKSLLGINSPSTVMQEIGINIIEGLLNGISNTWQSIVDFFSKQIVALVEFIEKKWSDLKEKTIQTWNQLKDKLIEITNNLKQNITEAWSKTRDKVVEITDNLKNKIQEKWNQLKDKVVNTVSALKDKIVENWNTTKEKVIDTVENIKQGVSDKWSALKDRVSELTSNLKETVSSKWADIKNAVRDAASDAASAAKDKWSDMKSALSSRMADIKSDITSKWRSIRDVIARTDLSSAGRSVINSFKSGLQSAWSSVTSWASSAVNSLKSSVSGAVSWVRGKVGKHRTGLREVPYDGYKAILHKGERVLTAAQANQYEKNQQAIQPVPQTIINFNGQYGFNNKEDIDYFMSEAGKMIRRKAG